TSLTVRLSLTALSKVEWAALSLSKGGQSTGRSSVAGGEGSGAVFGTSPLPWIAFQGNSN
ncbi:MAG: hypothetical protein ACRD88_00365, partial [Terriglobia bacterium]